MARNWRADRPRETPGIASGMVSDPEPFYFPTPSMFAHADAYAMYTGYAAKLEEAGLASRFPARLSFGISL